MTGTHGGGASDFDFLIGSWEVENEKLAARFQGGNEWRRFTMSATCRKILNGMGNFDEVGIPGGTFTGVTLRIFDPQTGLWSIHWADNERHRVLPPMVGRFENGVGTFYGDEEHEGETVRARFIWIPSPDAPRWEQAFSKDSGETWETNWVMTFRRTA